MPLGKLLASGLLTAQARHLREQAEARMAAVILRIIGGLMAMLFTLIALVFAALAAFFWLHQTQPAHLAALWVAGGLLVLALVVWMIGAGSARSRLRAARSPSPCAPSPAANAAANAALGAPSAAAPSALEQAAMDTGREIGAKVNDSLTRHPFATVGLALATGVVLALLSPRHRE